MGDRYEPESDFLGAILSGNVPLPDDEPEEGATSALHAELSEANLQKLICFTRDEVLSNRDWATFLLAQREIDTPLVRHALLRASGDVEDNVRHEALWGLARRDPGLALPLVREALEGSAVSVPLMEAAALCADRSLVLGLREWAGASGLSDAIMSYLRDALAACESGTPSA